MTKKASKLKPGPTTLFLVLQEGGSSGECYPELYNDERAAAKAVRGHNRATYRATAPMEVPVTVDEDGVAHITEHDLIDVIAAARTAEYEYS